MGANPMKFLKLFCFMLFCGVVFSGMATAADYVNIGDPTAEMAHNALSWGPSEPGTSGGSFGGIAGWPGTCAVVWHPNDDNPLAEVDMNFSGGTELITFQHLDGPADDSFDVYVEGVYLWSYTDSGDPGEYWHTNGFPYTPASGAGAYTVGFVATGQKWGSFDTYGQVAIAGVWVGDGPVATDNSTWGSVKSLFR